MDEEIDYFKLNRTLLTIIGLWPCRYKVFQVAMNLFMVFTTICFVVLQVIVVFMEEVDFNYTLFIFSNVLPSAVGALKYITFYVQPERIEQVIYRMYEHWSFFENNTECLNILRSYARGARNIVVTLTMCTCLGLGAFLLLQCTPNILDIIMPLNESRPHHVFVDLECFGFDKNKHYSVYLLYMNILTFPGVVAILCTESMTVVYLMHVASLFDIVGYQFENAMARRNSKSSSSCYENLIHGVNIHQKTVDFAGFLWSCFGLSYVLLLMIGAASITLNLYRLYLAFQFLQDIGEIIACILFILGESLYMFLCHYFCQIVTNCSADVFFRAYSMPWLEASCNFRKLVLFILCKTITPLSVGLPGIFAATLEGYFSIVSICMSYFMVLCSVNV